MRTPPARPPAGRPVRVFLTGMAFSTTQFVARTRDVLAPALDSLPDLDSESRVDIGDISN